MQCDVMSCWCVWCIRFFVSSTIVYVCVRSALDVRQPTPVHWMFGLLVRCVLLA